MKVLISFLFVFSCIVSSAQKGFFSGFTPAYQDFQSDSSPLEEILEKAAAATVIGLGEVTHGTQELADLQVWMAKKLIQDHRVNTLVLGEVGLVESLKLHRWLYLGDSSVRHEVLTQLPHLNDLFLWLEQHPQKIFILGADVSEPKALFSYLNTVFSSHEHVTARLRFLGQSLNKRGEVGPEDIHSAFETIRVALMVQDVLQDPFLKEALLRELAHQEHDFLLNNTEEVYLRRDEYIFNTILRVKEHVADARVFILATHNYHLNKAQIMTNLFNGVPTVGELLAQNFGNEYFVFGTEVGRGEFSSGLSILKVKEDSLKVGSVLHLTYPEAKWGVFNSRESDLNNLKWKISLGTAVSEILPGSGRIGTAFDALLYFRDSTPYRRPQGYALAYKITGQELAKMDGFLRTLVDYQIKGAKIKFSLVYYDAFDGIIQSHTLDHFQKTSSSIPTGAESAYLWLEVKGASPLHITAIEVNDKKIDPKRLKLVDSGRLGVRLKTMKKGVWVEL
jgi:hypothetical protein